MAWAAFSKGTARTRLMARLLLNLKFTKKNTKEGVRTSHSQAVNHLLKTYANDDVMAKADNDILNFTQEKHLKPLQLAHAYARRHQVFRNFKMIMY